MERETAEVVGELHEKAIGNHWNTPENVLSVIREFAARAGMTIALDPCSNPTSTVGAAIELQGLFPLGTVLSPELEAISECAPAGFGDGLKAKWEPCADGGLVFVNPPYGRGHLEKWCAKMQEEAWNRCEIVGLVPADVSTKWWKLIAKSADAIAFWSKRVRFGGALGSPKFGSALPYWGKRPEIFREVFSQHAWVVGPGR